MVKNQSTSKVAVATTASRQTESHEDDWKCSESRLPSLAVIFIFLICTTLETIFVCPWYVEYYPLEVWLSIIILLILTFIATIVNFSHASWMDPGYLPKAPDNRYLKTQPSLIKVNGVEIHLKHCRTCRYYRMPRTTHCSQCDHCVDHFDHHCPWVNNCIGRRNYRFFFGFLCCLTSHIIVSTCMCVYYLLKQPGDFFSDWNAHKAIALTVSVAAVLIFVPVVGLLCFHLFLVSKGLSTYEYVSKKYKGNSPFDMGPFQNCILQLCGAEYPVFKPPDFSLEDNNNESQSQEVQRDLVIKFAELNSRNDKDKDGFPFTKKQESSQVRKGTDDGNNNTLLDNDNGSVDSGNVFCGDDDGSSDNEDNVIRLRKGEHTVTVHTDSQTVLSIDEDDDAKYVGCDDSFSIVDENGISLADGSGDIWGPIESLSNATVDDTIH